MIPDNPLFVSHTASQMESGLTIETVELACIVKAICDEYGIKQEELEFVPSFGPPLSDKEARIKKRVVVKIPIPRQIAPKNSDPTDPHFRLIQARVFSSSPDYEMEAILSNAGYGLTEIELRGRHIQFWGWVGSSEYIYGHRSGFFVRKKDVFRFIRAIKEIKTGSRKAIEPPILPPDTLIEIYNNSVGFLRKGKENKSQYEKYNIPYKRGILLSGTPGCGKTMTCKWLKSLCVKHGFTYSIISMERYREASHRGHVKSLFLTPRNKSGIIFFDDMDVMVKNRKESANSNELSTFLSELDGITPVEGVVYIFTTNYIKELDSAFVRPGRIDLWLPFNAPTAKLRQKFIEAKFDAEILKVSTVEDLVEKTKEYTYAEIEEVRKLFCMDLIDGKELNSERTFEVFNKHRKDFEERSQFGFGAIEEKDEDEDDYFSPSLPFPWDIPGTA